MNPKNLHDAINALLAPDPQFPLSDALPLIIIFLVVSFIPMSIIGIKSGWDEWCEGTGRTREDQ